MRKSKKKKLEAAGWKAGTVEESLGLSPEETAFIELKLALSDLLKKLRKAHKLSQTQVARRIRSSQSRVAKMEAGDPSVSLDLLVKSLLAVGASKEDLAKTIRK